MSRSVRRTGSAGERATRGLGFVAGCALALVLVLVLGSGVALAAGEGPRWALLSTATPTNVQPDSPRDEAQQLAVNGTGGTFTLTVAWTLFGACQASETTAPIAWDASATVVQEALEALQCRGGKGGLAVSGGPGGSSPYTVTFVGANLGERRQPAGLSVDGSGLTGAGAGASVSTVAVGASPPELIVTATNVGGGSTNGGEIAMEDTLPAGMSAASVVGYDVYHSGLAFNTGGSAAMSCATGATVVCTWGEPVDPGDQLVMIVKLAVGAVSGSPVNRVVVSGGGAEASAAVPVSTGGTPAGFGPQPGGGLVALSSSQAGAHSNTTAAFTLDTEEPDVVSGYPRDVRFDLPPGLVGSVSGVPQCTISQVVETFKHPETACPADAMVGIATATFGETTPNRATTIVAPVYNISPAPGEPAAFAFNAFFLSVRIDTSVLSDGNYGIRVGVSGVSQEAHVMSGSITIWGVPAEHSGPGHDKSQSMVIFGGSFGGPALERTPQALLSAPQQCNQELTATMEADSWEQPGLFRSLQVPVGTLSGCGLLSFESGLSQLPDTLEAGEPAGYTTTLKVPQTNSPGALATPNVRDVKVTFPAGVVVNPSAAWGLSDCGEAEFYGGERGEQEPAKPGRCPRESQIGTVEVKTPALPNPLEGELYLAKPECDPCTPHDAESGHMLRLFLQLVGEGESGIVVKTEGRGMLDQQTGQVTAVFENSPPLPFSELKLVQGGGPRAVFANPRACGLVSSSGELTPWSSPFTQSALDSSAFEVNEGCFGEQFNPSFVAGTTSIQAGGYSPFTLSFGRADQDEYLGGIKLEMPPGLLGMLSHVSLCGEPQAAEGACPESSLIGHIQVLTGPGADPYLVTDGKVYVTQSYGGAPFGLSIVVPAVAGPFTLAGTTGKGTVVVRARIGVDPTNAHLMIVSDPFPTSLDGIPLQLRVVNVTVDRPEFTFNPTSCEPESFGGTLQSSTGATAAISSRFQVTNCGSLSFKPVFQVATSAHTSRVEGASLHVTLSLPQNSMGTGANVARVKVSLPKALPTPLPTLQKACTEKVFAENPASCPEASRVGEARVSTPVLEGELSGPAYFVSHGGAKYPELIMALTGENGVSVQVHGETSISKQGITTATFNTVPDVPFSTFELTLPQRKYPALTANGNLCTAKNLVMPTEIAGQNGLLVKQSTKIAVTGCGKTKVKRAHHAKKRAKGGRKGKQKR